MAGSAGHSLCGRPACNSGRDDRSSGGPAWRRPFNTPIKPDRRHCTKSAQRRSVASGVSCPKPCSSSTTIRSSAACSKPWSRASAIEALIADGGDAAAALLSARGAAHRLRGARPGDARPRRARRAGAHARGRPRHSGDRADRPWRHRQRRVGDARGRDRLRGQAGERRAAAGLAAQRARDQGAGWRIAAHQAQPRRHAHASPTSITRSRRHAARCCARPRRRPAPRSRC